MKKSLRYRSWKLFALLVLGSVLASCGQQALPTGGTEQLEATASNCKNVFLRGVYITDTREWPSDPEIYLASKVRDSNVANKHSLANVNGENTWYDYNLYLGCASRDALFYWYELDGTSLDVSIGVKGVSLGMKIDNDDDVYGGAQITTADMRPWRTTVSVGDQLKFKYCAVRTLSQGDSGSDVTQLQQRLATKGSAYTAGTPAYYIRTSGGPDGSFGSGTRNAVIAFQKMTWPSNSGEWDGIAGYRTWQALKCM